MKNTIVLLTLIIALFVVVSPAYADTGTVKPVCTTTNTWLDKLFGKCVEIKQDKLPVNATPVIDLDKIGQDVTNSIANGLTQGNTVSNSAPAVQCNANNIYGATGTCK